MEKQGNSISHWILSFLTQKINYRIIIISLVILVGFYFFYFYKKDLRLFPGNHNISINFYNDSADKGNSRILHSNISDTSISMSFVLKEGFSKPYVGININSKDGGKLALADYNQLQLQLSGQKIKDIVVYLVVKSKNKEKEGFENIHFGQNIEVSNSRTRYSIPLNLFKTPDWWYDVKKIVPNQTYQLDLENVTNINFATNLVFPLNVEQSLQIQSIEFSRNNKWTIIIMLISELLIIAILVLVHYFRFPNNIKEQPLIIAYRPVEVENKKMPKSESFFDYISNNFNNSELNLNLIASATGFNQRYISESISQKFNCNVKTYINQIRIKEAQRLLTTTDLNISEIAYKVGFNSPNNFNRVFKKLTGNNPSDFVQNKE